MVSWIDKKEYLLNNDYLLYEYPFSKQITSAIADTWEFMANNDIHWKCITNDKPLQNYTKSLL